MIQINFPGQNSLKLSSLICDINGTLAVDGQLIEGVQAAVEALKPVLDIYLLSADTHGTAAALAKTLGVKLQCLEAGNEARQKENYLLALGAETTAAIGQGANDALMLKKAALGICVLSQEGTAMAALSAADLVVPDILTAFELLQNPMRIVATLRQ